MLNKMSVRGSRREGGPAAPYLHCPPPRTPANDNIPAGFRALITHARAALLTLLPDASCAVQVGQQGFLSSFVLRENVFVTLAF